MCQFIETIQILDGKIQRLEYHQKRMDTTRHHFFEKTLPIDLKQHIQPLSIPGEIKCRIVYSNNLIDISYSPYAIRNIQSLRLIFNDDIVYPFKNTDRNKLIELSEQKGDFDEILIVRNGLLTDTSYTNIALYDGKNWITPANPLLKGTQRDSLIDQEVLHEQDIHVEDLHQYQQLCLINAMIDFGKVVIPVSHIGY